MELQLRNSCWSFIVFTILGALTLAGCGKEDASSKTALKNRTSGTYYQDDGADSGLDFNGSSAASMGNLSAADLAALKSEIQSATGGSDNGIVNAMSALNNASTLDSQQAAIQQLLQRLGYLAMVGDARVQQQISDLYTKVAAELKKIKRDSSKEKIKAIFKGILGLVMSVLVKVIPMIKG